MPPRVLVSADPARQNQEEIPEHAVFAGTVSYTVQIPEYPKTAVDGFLYAVSTEALTEQEKVAPWDLVRITSGLILDSLLNVPSRYSITHVGARARRSQHQHFLIMHLVKGPHSGVLVALHAST